MANLKVSLIDAPGDYEAVYIDIQDVQVNPSGTDSGWYSLENAQYGVYDLLLLTNGEEAFLGEIALPEGKLSQVRLVLGDDNRVTIDGQDLDLKVPSGSTSGLKVNVNTDLVGGVTYSLVLDFDAGRSVVKSGNSGNYNLKPVIRANLNPETGAISGEISPTDLNAAIFAIQNGDTITSTYPDETGGFLLQALPEGIYSVVAQPESDSGLTPTTIDDVSVSVGEVTSLGTVLVQ